MSSPPERAGGGPARERTARERMLARVAEALRARPRTEHPGPFAVTSEAAGGAAPERPPPRPPEVGRFSGNVSDGAAGDALTTFRERFVAAGGEVVHVADRAAAAGWLVALARELGSVAVGRTVPEGLRDVLPRDPPETAALGVSMARGAVAETGSLVMEARDGRRVQLLPPVHVVLVAADSVHGTLRSALLSMQEDLPSAIGLHSGPSKSADLGQVLVTGVHGPGRVIALVVGEG